MKDINYSFYDFSDICCFFLTNDCQVCAREQNREDWLWHQVKQVSWSVPVGTAAGWPFLFLVQCLFRASSDKLIVDVWVHPSVAIVCTRHLYGFARISVSWKLASISSWNRKKQMLLAQVFWYWFLILVLNGEYPLGVATGSRGYIVLCRSFW